MTDFWPEHDPEYNKSNPPEEMRGAAVVEAFREVLEERGGAVTAQEVFGILGGVIIDLEGRLVQMRRQLNEAGS